MRWLHDGDAAAAQGGHVVLGSRIEPHFRVHGWHHDDRARRHQNRGGKKVVGSTRGKPGHEIRSGRCDNDSVRLLPQSNVLNFVDGIEDGRRHRLARQGLKGSRAHEVERRRSGHHAHLVAVLLEVTNEVAGLVGGDAAAHADEDAARLGRRVCRGGVVLRILSFLHSADTTQDIKEPTGTPRNGVRVGSVRGTLCPEGKA